MTIWPSLTTVVPYRNRREHLEQFLHHMQCWDVGKLVIVEQADEKPFNRGKLLNIGALEHPNKIYCFHDIDMLPIEVKYEAIMGITQLAKSELQLRDYLGGVTMFSHRAFAKLGGYHNDYFHRAEDNEMMFNIKRSYFKVAYSFGEFRTLPHPRTGPEFDKVLWRKAQLPRDKNMLATCEYEIAEHVTITKPGFSYTHLKVRL